MYEDIINTKTVCLSGKSPMNFIFLNKEGKFMFKSLYERTTYLDAFIFFINNFLQIIVKKQLNFGINTFYTHNIVGFSIELS